MYSEILKTNSKYTLKFRTQQNIENIFLPENIDRTWNDCFLYN